MSMHKILLVEDDEGIAEGIVQLASQWNLEVKPVKDFRNVMGEFAEYNPQLILLDISLPAYDGYYWCTQIRAQSKVPIIFISSTAENMNIVMAMNMGADDFIAKPFDGNVLVAKIQALLRRTYDFGEAVPDRRGGFRNQGRVADVRRPRRLSRFGGQDLQRAGRSRPDDGGGHRRKIPPR